MKSEIAERVAAVSVLGVGAVTPIGRSLEEIAKRLMGPAPDAAGGLRVSDELLSDPAIGSQMRRADRFSRMAAVAALDCWADAKKFCVDVAKERIGLIVTSGFGPHCRGFRFLDGILDCGDGDALPTDFSHSVHGAAAAYISQLLELRGPTLTTTDFENGFENAILLAQCWLDQGVCERVIVGAVEEIGEVLVHCSSRMLSGEKNVVLGEGAVFMMLGPGDRVGVARLTAVSEEPDVDLMILDVPGILRPIVGTSVARARQMTTFSLYFGQSASGSAFQLLGGFLSMRAGSVLGCKYNLGPSPLPSPGVPGEGVNSVDFGSGFV